MWGEADKKARKEKIVCKKKLKSEFNVGKKRTKKQEKRKISAKMSRRMKGER